MDKIKTGYEIKKTKTGYFIQNEETGERGNTFKSKSKAVSDFKKNGIREGAAWDKLKSKKSISTYGRSITPDLKKKRRKKLKTKNVSEKSGTHKDQMNDLQRLIDKGTATKQEKAKFRRLRRKLNKE